MEIAVCVQAVGHTANDAVAFYISREVPRIGRLGG